MFTSQRLPENAKGTKEPITPLGIVTLRRDEMGRSLIPYGGYNLNTMTGLTKLVDLAMAENAMNILNMDLDRGGVGAAGLILMASVHSYHLLIHQNHVAEWGRGG